MTEKQGGSDVRANTTRAEPQSDGTYELTGHKWFCSYPPCDVFLTLAQTPDGPVLLPGRGRATRAFGSSASRTSSAPARCPRPRSSSAACAARLVGEEGRGVPAIIRMVNHTRLDCLIGSAAGHALGHRPGHPPRPPPLARSARRWSISRPCATCSPTWRSSPRPPPPRRCASPAPTTRTTAALPPLRHRGRPSTGSASAPPRTPSEALECLGGNGYVEESGMPRLFRDSPLNSIWEGSGNVAALDVLRAMVKEPEGLPAFLAECEQAAAPTPDLDAHVAGLKDAIAGLAGDRGHPVAPGAGRGPRPRAAGEPARAPRARRRVRRVLRRPPGRPGRSRLRHAARGRRRGTAIVDRRARRLDASTLTYAVDGPRRPDHARPPRARQRHHAGDAARAGRRRRAGRPRPGGPRHRAVRQRQGLLRRLRPGRRRPRAEMTRPRHGGARGLAAGPRRAGRQPRPLGRPGTRSWTTR